jgi:hypothetical protein
LKLALKGDDDCIQQWFDGKHVIKLIEDARSFDEMLLGARAIQGDHDTDPDVMAYVKRILGDEW